MSFIAKNPLALPEVGAPSSLPAGTRGLFAGKDGFYQIDSDNNIGKIATVEYVTELLLEMVNKAAPTPASITLYADRWKQSDEENVWYQIVVVANATITEYSKVDLQLSPEQLSIFHEKDLSFVAENDGGVVTVYCIGQKPTNDYTIQATIMEVSING